MTEQLKIDDPKRRMPCVSTVLVTWTCRGNFKTRRGNVTLYRNKYRVESTRLKNRDYSSNGYYFITICTMHRECLLGTIAEGEMHFSAIGNIVLQGWNESFAIRRELQCDTFVIMPNHIHGIVVIENPVETHGRASLRHTIQGRTIFPCRSPRSVSSFVAGFKSAMTKRINEFRRTPGVEVWQPRFYDHVIRNEKSLCTIRDYILNNPTNWQEDEMNPNFS